MMNIEEAIESFSDFEKRASAKRSDQIDQIKEDRDFLGGKQWDKSDARLVTKGRPKRTVNVLANSVNSVVNGYAEFPFKWYAGDAEVDELCDTFLKTGSNARAVNEALHSVVAYGLAYLMIGSTEMSDEFGEKVDVPCLYCPPDVCDVYFDPDSVEIDGNDALEAAIVEIRSKNYVKAKYGEEYVSAPGYAPIINVSANKNPEAMAIVTYFKVEDGKCSVYRMINEDFLEEPTQINLNRVPIFPVYGETVFCDGELNYEGLVHKAIPIQKLINYAYTQLGERLAKAPKNAWMATPESIEGYYDGWKNFDNNLNPILLWNDKSPDGKREYPQPIRMDNVVKYDDIVSIIGNNLELMATITGVSPKGIVDAQQQVTATEVIYNERMVQQTIRHYYTNLRDTFKAVGEAIVYLFGYGQVNLEVTQGPAEHMQKQVARQELIQLAGLVPDDQKKALVMGVLQTHEDNKVLSDVYRQFAQSTQPTQNEINAMNAVEQMKQEIQSRDQQIAELQKQIDYYEKSSADQERALQADFAKMQMTHEQKLEEMAFSAQLDQGLDADKAAIDAQKAQMDLQKGAIQLETAKVKAAAEQTKAVTGMFQAAQPKKEVNNDR